MRPMWARIGPIVISTTLLAALPVFGKQPAAPPRQVTEAVQVHVVNVEVFVTRADGQPVFDLKPDEFELREDGVVVPLTNFLGPTQPLVAKAPQARPGGSATAEIAPPSEEEQQRTLVVFVDDLNLTVSARKPVLDRLGQFLTERLQEGYRVILFSFSRSLRRLTPLTRDSSQITAALGVLKRTAFEGMMLQAQRDSILRDMGRPVAQESGEIGDAAREAILDSTRSGASETTVLERSLLEALTTLVDSLSGVPGRKVVLFVSQGIPTNPNADLFVEFGARFAGGQGQSLLSPENRLRHPVQVVALHANASRITFYTINAGSEEGFGISAQVQAPNASTLGTNDVINRDESLSELTTGTGGRKLFNADALEGMAAELDTYYSLGYSPDHFGDGRYHRLSVKVKRAGVSVRCREGYLDKTPEQRQADRTTAALLAGGNANPLGARVELGTPQRQGRKKITVPLTVTIPAAVLVLLEAGEFHEGKVSITIAVAKHDGRTSDVHRETFPIKVPSRLVAGFLGQETSFDFTVLVETGDTSVSVTARDDVAQVESVVVCALAMESEKR
jgi:VWFA-related protein